MTRSLALAVYLALSDIAAAPAWAWLWRRTARGKEDPARLPERRGRAGRPRPEGRLVWFHAASVGESVSLLGLIESFLEERPDTNVLLTTGTRSSAELMARRLPARAIHQFVPLDTGPAVRRFLTHWRPDLAVWTESDLWPRLICATRRLGCPMLIVNARISDRSMRRLRWAGGYAASLLNRFDRILAQDDVVAERLRKLGADDRLIEIAGSLKDTAEPLPHEPTELATLRKILGGRPVWHAASTHPGEEAIAAVAHRDALRRYPGLMMIVSPRHPERGQEVARMLRADGWKVALRSAGDRPQREADIYVADTLGEMGLWYRAAAVSFIGGSLVPAGGHNPFEPALLGSAILHGPHVANFETAYARFRRAGAAVLVPEPGALTEKLVETLRADRAAALATAAWTVSSEGADVKRRVLDVIEQHLPAAE